MVSRAWNARESTMACAQRTASPSYPGSSGKSARTRLAKASVSERIFSAIACAKVPDRISRCFFEKKRADGTVSGSMRM